MCGMAQDVLRGSWRGVLRVPISHQVAKQLSEAQVFHPCPPLQCLPGIGRPSWAPSGWGRAPQRVMLHLCLPLWCRGKKQQGGKHCSVESRLSHNQWCGFIFLSISFLISKMG